MKHLKTKLMAAVAMLLVATVMLTSASFAWFTISTAPEVKELTTSVVVNENLEIALLEQADAAPTAIPAAAAVGDSYDASNDDAAYKWGNLVNLGTSSTTDNAKEGYGDLVKTVRPATIGVANETRTLDGKTTGTKLTQGKFYYPAYGTDGRVDELKTLTDGILSSGVTKAQWGFGNLIVAKTASSTDKEAGKVYGYYVDYWVRSNISGDLVLVDGADTTATKRSTEGVDGEGTYFKSNNTSGTNPTVADQKTALKAVADNIRIAFLDITPKVTGATEADANATPYVAEYAKDTTSTTAPYTTTFNCGTTGKIATLTANNAKLIRVYVYLEGEAVTNAAASLDDPSFTNGGTLNIQFKLVDSNDHTKRLADLSMDSVS